LIICKPQREGDEYACNCGFRWGVGEDDPHQAANAEIKRLIELDKIRELLKL
jgi:hypothetical protein